MARLWAALMKRARRWFMLCRVHVRVMQSEAVPTELENGVSIRTATRDDLFRAAREMPKQLGLEFVEDALARGDICLAAFHDETMVAFIWRSFTRVPHADGLWIEVEWPYRYGYKAYTKPDFRGQGLSGWLSRLGDEVCLARGFKYGVGFVETHNYPSIKADLRVGGRRVGYAGYVKLFGKAYPFRTRGVVPHSFRFYRPKTNSGQFARRPLALEPPALLRYSSLVSNREKGSAMSSQDHEQVSIYPFSDEDREDLLSKARECVFNWTTKDGWAVGVVHAFVWHEGRAWITCGAHRHRVSAIRRDPRCSVVVSGIAAPDGPNGAITIKGRAIIHDDEETKRWFYPALARGPYGRAGGELTPEAEEQAKAFEERLDSPLRVIIEIVPEKWITLDSDKMAKDTAGELTDEERGPVLEADAKRMPEELKRRGID